MHPGCLRIPISEIEVAHMPQHMLRVDDDKGIREIILDAPRYSIGRDPQCDIRVFSQFISRHHATLVQMPNDNDLESFYYLIFDGIPTGRQSANGLFINGQQLQVHTLYPQDEIAIGQARLVYYMDDSESGSSPDEKPPSDPNTSSPRRPYPDAPNSGAEAFSDEGISSVP